MAKKSKTPTDDLAAVEELMQDLEARLRRLNTKAKTTGPDSVDDIGDFVSQTLARIAAHVRETAGTATDTLANEATEAGTDLIKKIWHEMESRPLMTLALAAAAGYVIGLNGKQDDAG